MTDLSVIKLDLQMSHDTLITLGDSIKLTASINLPLTVTWKWSPNIFIKCDICAATWTIYPSNPFRFRSLLFYFFNNSGNCFSILCKRGSETFCT